MAAPKLSLVGFVPPRNLEIETKEPELTPAVVKLLFGDTFKAMYFSETHAALFDSVDNATAVYGMVSIDQALLVQEAVKIFREKNDRPVAEKDYARISKGLNQWLKDNHASRRERQAIAKSAALAALPPMTVAAAAE